ncbi:hypothetical protein DL96DRAFT_1101725 [Flagelloscypha sp. PMI_526]|nr:hypothetical protein DL96DRAFT_1101725 [Flagelloscypha sp. PMI_526]
MNTSRSTTTTSHSASETSTSLILGVPPEILLYILDLVLPPPFFEEDFSFSDLNTNFEHHRATQALPLQLVNRAFRNASLPLLYGSILLPSVGHLLALGQTLRESKSIASQISSIVCLFFWDKQYFKAAEQELEWILQSCPRLPRVKISTRSYNQGDLDVAFTSFLYPWTQVTHLDLSVVSLETIENVFRAMADHLCFAKIELDKPLVQPTSLNAELVVCPFLVHLHLSFSWPSTFKIFQRWRFQSLVHLTINLPDQKPDTFIVPILIHACQSWGGGLETLQTLHGIGGVSSVKEGYHLDGVQTILDACPKIRHWITVGRFISPNGLSHPTLQQIDVFESGQSSFFPRGFEDFRDRSTFPSLVNIRTISLDLYAYPPIVRATAPYLIGAPHVFDYVGTCIVSTEDRLFKVNLPSNHLDRFMVGRSWIDSGLDPGFPPDESDLEDEDYIQGSQSPSEISEDYSHSDSEEDEDGFYRDLYEMDPVLNREELLEIFDRLAEDEERSDPQIEGDNESDKSFLGGGILEGA